MREPFRPVTINFASVNVVGGPGLALVLVAMAIAVEFPEARWLVLASLAAGSVVATVLILWRRRGGARDDDNHRRGILMACERPLTRQGGWSSRPPSGSAQVSRPALKWS
jgi:hypothetical protein